MKRQELQAGDLLFMRDFSKISQAIQKATGLYSHVAIYFNQKIYHATQNNGVIKQNLREFMKMETFQIFVYRYPKIDSVSVQKRAELLLGSHYNHSFYPNNNAYYCSQYIAEILPIFSTIPMKFGDETGVISDFWRDYYRRLGLEVPLNLPGTNPSQLSQSKQLHYVGELYD